MVFDGPGFLLIRRSLVRAQVEEPMNSRGYMLKRVAPFHFTHRISHRMSGLPICTTQQEQWYRFAKKVRNFKVRIFNAIIKSFSITN